MIVVFDTETNGLPKSWNSSAKDVDNWPRVIQLAYAVFQDDGKCIGQYCELIKPDGWEIPTSEFWTKHGYSTETNAEKGVSMVDALKGLCHVMDMCHTIVAHNMGFDHPVISAEMIRYGIRPSKPITKVCTMKSSTDYVGATDVRGRTKWPKLEELHTKLFGAGFEGAHDALNDVLACSKCFFELRKRNIITQITL